MLWNQSEEEFLAKMPLPGISLCGMLNRIVMIKYDKTLISAD
jgi:hypothetical protein